MGRPGKIIVDYFPHVTNTGKTIAIIESRWGNDGYSFWFKLLELLGNTSGFCYNCGSASDWEYLLSKTKVSEPVAVAILDKLAEIEAIDTELWRKKRIWSDNFVSGVARAFEKRKGDLPLKPDLATGEADCTGISAPETAVSECTDEFTTPETGKGEEMDEINRDDKKSEDRNRVKTSKRHKKAPPHPCPSSLRGGVESLADTVYLKPLEVARLQQEYGQNGMRRLVEILDAYKTNHPDKCAEYRDDYKVITAWVITRYRDECAPLTGSRRVASPPRQLPVTFIDRLAEMAREEKL